MHCAILSPIRAEKGTGGIGSRSKYATSVHAVCGERGPSPTYRKPSEIWAIRRRAEKSSNLLERFKAKERHRAVEEKDENPRLTCGWPASSTSRSKAISIGRNHLSKTPKDNHANAGTPGLPRASGLNRPKDFHSHGSWGCGTGNGARSGQELMNAAQTRPKRGFWHWPKGKKKRNPWKRIGVQFGRQQLRRR